MTTKAPGRLPLAVAQMGPVQLAETRAAVVARLLAMMREAAGRGARMVVFPELALTTFFPRYWMEDAAEVDARFFEKEMPGPETRILFDTGRELGIAFYLGYAELTPEGQHFNTSILVDAAGRIAARYRKIHLPGHADHKPEAPFQHLEKKYFEVGNDGFGVTPFLGTRVGQCICNDRRWPETYRVMSLQGARLVVLGYNTPSWNIHWAEPAHLRMFHHLLSLQANAYQNGLWVAAAAKCGLEDGFHLIGGSAIVAPTGEIVAQAQGEADEVLFANCDLGLGEPFLANVFDFARHRRPEHYRLITERVGAGDPLSPTELVRLSQPSPAQPPLRGMSTMSTFASRHLRHQLFRRHLVLAAGVLLSGLAAAQSGPPLRTGVDATFAPHAMVKLEGGLQGFNIDLGNELARRMGRAITIEGTEFSGLVPGLNARKYDFVLAPVTATPERAKAMLFTEGYLDTDYTFVTKKGAPAVASLDDLKGKTLSVNKGSAYENWARDNAPKYGFKYDVYGNNADAVQAVQSGRADANLAGNTVSAWAAKQNPAVQTGYTVKTGLVWALAFRLDDKAGRDAAGNALKCMKMDGTVAKLATKWFGFTPGPEATAVKVTPGQGVEGLEGYDATVVKPTCAKT